MFDLEAASRFDDPAGDGARAQVESLEHDLRMDLEAVARPATLVVDAEGRPLKVFRGEHGEGHGGQIQSRLGSISFTAEREVAEIYAREPNDRTLDASAKEPRILEAYLDIRKPVVNDPDDPFVDFAMIEEALGRSEALAAMREFAGYVENTGNWMDEINPGRRFDGVADFLDQFPDRAGELYFDAYPLFDSPDWVAKFKAAGFDGAIHGGNGESALTTEYKVFSPDQVKRSDAAKPTPAIDAGAPQAANDPLPDLEPHLADADRAELAAAYGQESFDVETARRFADDFSLAIAKGLDAVGEAVRAVIVRVQRAILAASVVFNPHALAPLPAAAAELIPTRVAVRAEVPASAAAELSGLARTTYEAMAPAAKRTGKGFIIADKPAGKIHVFGKDGELLASSAALYGRNAGDAAAPGATAAGAYKIRFADYQVKDQAAPQMGKVAYLIDQATGKNVTAGDGIWIGVHQAYLGQAAEGRLGRLASDTADDNKISSGCINTTQEFMVREISGRSAELEGGLIFTLPDNAAAAADLFPAGTREVPGGNGAPANRSGEGVAKREEETPAEARAGASAVLGPDPDRIISGQRGADIDELLARATANQAVLGRVGRELEGIHGARFIDPGPKSKKRVLEKMADYADAGEIKDLARASFIVSDVAQAQKIIDGLAGRFDLYDKGWKRLETNYYDRKIILRFDNGGVAEVQFVPEKIAEYKLGRGHELYEVTRDPKASIEEFEAAMREMRESYAALLEGTDFAASGKASARSAAVSGEPSTSALRTSDGDASFQAPSLNTNPALISPSGTATARSSSSNNLMSSASPAALDMGAKADPGKAAREAQLLELGTAAPMRAAAEQDGTLGLGLFDAADQPTFRLEVDGEERGAADILAELEQDAATIDALKICALPGKAAA